VVALLVTLLAATPAIPEASDASLSPADRIFNSSNPVVSPSDVDAVFAAERSAVVRLQRDNFSSVGVIVSRVGLVVAPGRLLRDGQSLTADFADGTHADAQVLISDPAKNLALIRLKGQGPFNALQLAPRLPENRDPLFVEGFSSGAWHTSAPHMVSKQALRDGHMDPALFQAETSADVGSEGAPIADRDGHLAGIVDALGDGTLWGRSSDAIRSFLDRAGLYAPDFSLVIRTDPPGVQAELDQRPVGKTSAAPMVLEHLTMGRHELKLSLPGMAEDRVVVELMDDPTTVVDRKLDVGGTVELSANADAQAWVDGAFRGDVPMLLTLPSGRHWVDLRANGYLTSSAPIDVPLGKRISATIEMTSVRSRLTVDSVPRGATVSANGEPLGATPIADASVATGVVQMEIQYPGKHAYRFKVNVVPDAALDLGTFRLEEPYGWLLPRLPAGTLIAVDSGSRHLSTPYEPISAGQHKLEVYAPGYYAYTTPLMIEDSQTLTLDPPLAIYDRLPARRAAGLALGGLSIGLGLTSLGLALDSSTNKAAGPVFITALVGLGASIFFMVTSGPWDEGGWTEERTFVRPNP
jgi:hypothetical protein